MVIENLFYTESHEWVKVIGEEAYVGITDFAQSELGDIVYVELPDEGSDVIMGEAFGSVEAVKAVEDILSPLSGEVVKVNTDLENSPELINQSPFEDGWLIKIRMSDKEELEKLLSPAEYTELIEQK
ncbi:MAG: glycine cleavage system protein GcvH [Candidatus Cloacimonetes bacterium]|nr:glycine cleavage system protein GcvH [Candidatus Cloacimonadota bacterium]